MVNIKARNSFLMRLPLVIIGIPVSVIFIYKIKHIYLLAFLLIFFAILTIEFFITFKTKIKSIFIFLITILFTSLALFYKPLSFTFIELKLIIIFIILLYSFYYILFNLSYKLFLFQKNIYNNTLNDKNIINEFLLINFAFFLAIIILSYNNLLLLFLLIIVWLSDIFAYLFGKKIGGLKLANKISPGKTIAGLIGGIITPLIIVSILYILDIIKIYFDNSKAFFILHSFDNFNQIIKNLITDFPYLVLITISLIIILTSIIGDLWLSMLKRIQGIKDTSKFFGEHGGILDRFDSIITSSIILAFLHIFIKFNISFNFSLS